MEINQLCNGTSICDSFLKNEVVVMENNPNTQSIIKDIIMEELEWQVTTVTSKSEVVALVKNKEAAFYILDVGMGRNREQEGLDALEQIKDIDKKVFVSVFSAYTKNQKQADRLEANMFQEKSSEVREDIRHIAYEMLNYQLKIIDSLRQQTVEKIKFINKIEKEYKLFSKDINIAAYEALKSNDEWLGKEQGKYVAFVDGKLVDTDSNQQILLERLKDSEHRNKPKFLTKVEENLRIIDIPSPL